MTFAAVEPLYDKFSTDLQEKFTNNFVKIVVSNRKRAHSRHKAVSNKNAEYEFLKITTFPLMPMY